MPEDEVRYLLQITVVIGVLLMSLLLGCYICVFRKLCCISDESHVSSEGAGGTGSGIGACRRLSHRCSRRSYGRTPSCKESLCMGEMTHVSSQPTETDLI